MKQLSMFDTKEELHKVENSNKTVVRFKENCKELNKDFIKGSEWELYREDKNNYVILIDETYYCPFKKHCEVIK